MRTFFGKHWPLLAGGIFLLLWGQQCGQTNAARAAYSEYREEQGVREQGLVDDLEDSNELAATRFDQLEEMVADNDVLREERDQARREAGTRERVAREAQPVVHENTDAAIEEIAIQFPETRPLVDLAHESLFVERDNVNQFTGALEVQRDQWMMDALDFQAERDFAIDVTIPALQVALDDAMALSEERLQRAIRAESEYEREKNSGIFDIGVPDWLGTGVALIGGATAGYFIGKGGG